MKSRLHPGRQMRDVQFTKGRAMTSRRLTATALAIAFLLVVAAASPNLPADGKSPPVSVSVEDIDDKVQLIGRLGEPLGTITTVTGRWFSPSKVEPVKDDSLRFLVSHVNQKKLAKEIDFNIAVMHLTTKDGQNAIPNHWKDQGSLHGQAWTLQVYETGSLCVEQLKSWQDCWKEQGIPPKPLPYWCRPFVSELHGYVVKE